MKGRAERSRQSRADGLIGSSLVGSQRGSPCEVHRGEPPLLRVVTLSKKRAQLPLSSKIFGPEESLRRSETKVSKLFLIFVRQTSKMCTSASIGNGKHPSLPQWWDSSVL